MFHFVINFELIKNKNTEKTVCLSFVRSQPIWASAFRRIYCEADCSRFTCASVSLLLINVSKQQLKLIHLGRGELRKKA